MLFYHNPRCSKSRQALALLESAGHCPHVKRYLDDGLDADEVVDLAKKLGRHPSEFIRKNESVYKALGTDEFSIEEWADIIENNPILLERPILVYGNKAVIGRPPENVLTLLTPES
ncbi:MAG: arsenate reductase (glutaredoxin) [Candidatus Margulisiibacteriota bacterium]